jgi:hypothetical protein
LDFLKRNPRYNKAGYFAAATAEDKAKALQRAGYATDPNYADKLIKIMSQLTGATSAEIDPRMASAEPMAGEPLANPDSLPDRASRPTGLDSAVRFAAAYPGEVSPLEVERMANTGRLAAPVTSKDGLNVDVSDPYTLETMASRRGPASAPGLRYITEPGGGMTAVREDTGEEVWRRPPPETRMEGYKLEGERIDLLDKSIEFVFGKDVDPRVKTRLNNTIAVLDLDLSNKELMPVLQAAERNTAALEERNRGWKIFGNSNTTYDTVTVGLGAAALGIDASTDGGKEIAVRIEAPLRALIGPEGASADMQHELVTKLVLLQKNEGMTPWEAAQFIADAMAKAEGREPVPLEVVEVPSLAEVQADVRANPIAPGIRGLSAAGGVLGGPPTRPTPSELPNPLQGLGGRIYDGLRGFLGSP